MRIASLLALATLLLASPLPARACRCGGPTHGAEALAQADVAVVGEVTRVLETDLGPEGFVLRIDERFKGPSSDTLTIRMALTSCAFRDVHVGDEWLVFARRIDGVLTTHKCTGTLKLRHAGGDRTARGRRWVRATARAARR